jgi:hypothetical protein
MYRITAKSCTLPIALDFMRGDVSASFEMPKKLRRGIEVGRLSAFIMTKTY